MKMYCLIMQESEIVLYSEYGALFTPDIVFDGRSLQFVPNKGRKMLVGTEFLKGLYSVELCRLGAALHIKNLPCRVDLDCVDVM